MNKETLQLLQQFADKIGTTSEHILSMYTRFAFWDGIMDLGYYLLTVIGTIIWFRYYKKYREGEDYYLPLVITGCILTLFIVVELIVLPMTILAFTNPELWAIEHILDKILSR